VAYDLMLGRQVNRSWSRGSGFAWTGNWAEERALGAAKKKIPWVPIAAGAAAIGFLVLLPSVKKAKAHGGYVRDTGGWTEPTIRIPRESMEDLPPLHEIRKRK
jgi:hypothetical protein